MTAPTAPGLASLKQLLLRNSVRFGEFTLVSGQKSNVYVDSKLTTYLPEAIPLVGRAFLEKIQARGWDPEAVGGLTLGADPIALAIARESLEHAPHPIRAFVARKQPKDHGTQRFIEGMEDPAGVRVVVLDDVCSTGGSTAKAVQIAQDAGMQVLGAVCLVDREMGATDLVMRDFGLDLESVFKLSDLRAAA